MDSVNSDNRPLIINEESDDGEYGCTRQVEDANEIKEDNKDKDVIISSPPIKFCCPYVVELAIFAYFFFGFPMGPLISQYNYALVAQNLGKNYSNLSTNNGPVGGCNGTSLNGTHDPMYERRQFVQQNVSQLNIYSGLASLLPMLISTMFWGAYSDRMGRKVLMLLPTLGASIECGIYMLIMKFNLPVYTLLVPPIIVHFVGSMELIVLASFAFIADTCSPETKSFRMALIDILLLLAGAIAEVGTGYFIKAAGFFWPFLFVICGKLLVFVYILLFIPQTKPKVHREKKTILTYFNSTLKVYTRKPNNDRRWKLILLTLTYLVVRLGHSFDLPTLFEMNAPLCWGSIVMGYYKGYYIIIICLGMFIGTKIIKRWMSDEWVSAVGLASGIIGYCYFSFVKDTVMMFFVPVLLIFQLLPTPLIRAIMSNLVEPGEQGAMLAGLIIAGNTAEIISKVIMNPIYQATLKFWVGLVFLVTASGYLLAFISMLIYIYLTRNKLESNTEIINSKESEQTED